MILGADLRADIANMGPAEASSVHLLSTLPVRRSRSARRVRRDTYTDSARRSVSVGAVPRGEHDMADELLGSGSILARVSGVNPMFASSSKGNGLRAFSLAKSSQLLARRQGESTREGVSPRRKEMNVQ